MNNLGFAPHVPLSHVYLCCHLQTITHCRLDGPRSKPVPDSSELYPSFPFLGPLDHMDATLSSCPVPAAHVEWEGVNVSVTYGQKDTFVRSGTGRAVMLNHLKSHSSLRVLGGKTDIKRNVPLEPFGSI